MTKKLEEILDLPDSKEIIKQEKEKEKHIAIQQQNETLRDIAEMDKITSALPAVKGLGEMADTELNEVASKAMDAYDDLMDLGMNVDSRYSGRIFEVAGNFLRNAIDAKSGKIDKKLKMIELQLKKQKLDQGNKDDAPIEQSDGYVISDRNELMKKLLKKD